MENTNKTITRGSGSTSIVFDMSAFATPVDLTSASEVVCRIEENGAMRSIKLSSAIPGGSTDEVDINAGADTATVYFTEAERNVIPDTGYTHKVYVDEVMVAYGTITNSGTAPSGDPEAVVPFSNYMTTRHINENQDYAVITDDLIICDTDDAGLTGVDLFELYLDDPALYTGKKFTIYANGSFGVGVVCATTAQTFTITNQDEAIEVVSDGSLWFAINNKGI